MKLSPIAAALILALELGAAAAHHSANTYDSSAAVASLAGTVRVVNWTNPHVSFVLEADDGATWTFESVAPALFTSHGWMAQSLRPGDRAVLHYAPRVDRASGGGFLVGATLPDGRELTLSGPAK